MIDCILSDLRSKPLPNRGYNAEDVQQVGFLPEKPVDK